MKPINHYKWLEKYLDFFWHNVFGKSLNETGCAGIIGAHGDKCYQYEDSWEKAGIPFPHGTAMYMLTYTDVMDRPKYESCQWVIDNYEQYKDMLPEVDETDEDVICPFTRAMMACK